MAKVKFPERTVLGFTVEVAVRAKTFFTVGVVAVLLAGLFTTFGGIPAHAVCSGTCWTLIQDASNTGQTDILVQNSASNSHSFRIGAVLTNASGTNPLTVFGWQFAINYNTTEFTPQGDPNPVGPYPDGASGTVLLGAQTTTGTANWAGLVASGRAYSGASNIINGTIGTYIVFLALLAPNPALTITATNLLASVSFELNGPASPSTQSFSLSKVAFVDSNANPIPGIQAGGPVTETITDIPPFASMTASHEATGSSDCVPVTGINCSAFAFKFDGSASTAPSGTIANPAGYFWDFGDSSQDLGATGPVVVHDYGAFGSFDVTLRVVDSAGDTGSARNILGSVIVNSQPSHTQIFSLTSGAGPHPTTTTVSCVPSSLNVSMAASCNATVTDNSASPVTPSGAVNFTSSGPGSFGPGPGCSLSGSTASASCNFTFTPTANGTDTITGNYAGDTAHSASSGNTIINVGQAPPPPPGCRGTCWTLSQDAANTGQTDIMIQSSASNSHSFRIGAVLTNASVTNPLTVYGWQFAINYNATEFTPLGDPNLTGSYPDGASATVLLGAQTTSGTMNWAELVASGKAFSGTYNQVNGTIGTYVVYLTLIAPNQAVTITATNLLASVSFELNGPASPSTQSFSLSKVVFVDLNGDPIPGIQPGGPVAESITDIPPIARISATHEIPGSLDCVPVTGTTCSAFAFKFDGSASTAPSGTIANPAGYFWDFGDGSQDLGVTGPILVHDYRAPGSFNVTLRIVDSAGDTGSARDILGDLIINSQPSHTQILNLNSGDPDSTTTAISCTPSSLNVGGTTSCTATVTDNSAGPITPSGSVSFTSSGTGNFSLGPQCSLAGSRASASCSVTFTPTGASIDTITGTYSSDSAHSASAGSTVINVSRNASTTRVSCTPSTLKSGSSTTCTATVVGCSGSCPIPTGTISFASSGAGTFSTTTCTLVSGSGASSCSVTFTPSTGGTNTITGTYSGNSFYSSSSGTASLRVRGRPK